MTHDFCTTCDIF